jgi:hypothetical protein
MYRFGWLVVADAVASGAGAVVGAFLGWQQQGFSQQSTVACMQ